MQEPAKPFSKLNNLPRLLEFHLSKLSILKHSTCLWQKKNKNKIYNLPYLGSITKGSQGGYLRMDPYTQPTIITQN